jgi:hypothetical protein
MRFAYQPSKILADSHKYTGGGAFDDYDLSATYTATTA